MTTEKGGSGALKEIQPFTCAHVGWQAEPFPAQSEERAALVFQRQTASSSEKIHLKAN